MNKVFYVLRDAEGNTTASVGTHEQFCTDIFSPEIEVECAFRFSVCGKTYAERKSDLREKAVEYSNADGGGLSWGEVAEICNFFETNGKRYGLVQEFKENGIC